MAGFKRHILQHYDNKPAGSGHPSNRKLVAASGQFNPTPTLPQMTKFSPFPAAGPLVSQVPKPTASAPVFSLQHNLKPSGQIAQNQSTPGYTVPTCKDASAVQNTGYSPAEPTERTQFLLSGKPVDPGTEKNILGGQVYLDSSLGGLLRLDSSNSSFFDQYQVNIVGISTVHCKL